MKKVYGLGLCREPSTEEKVIRGKKCFQGALNENELELEVEGSEEYRNVQAECKSNKKFLIEMFQVF